MPEETPCVFIIGIMKPDSPATFSDKFFCLFGKLNKSIQAAILVKVYSNSGKPKIPISGTDPWLAYTTCLAFVGR